MEVADIEFIEENMINFDTIEHGYIRNMDHLIGTYEHIYRKYINPKYISNNWCSACVFRMMRGLKYYYLEFKKQNNGKRNNNNRKKTVPKINE